MKNIMLKIKRICVEHIWLPIIIVELLIASGAFGWHFSLKKIQIELADTSINAFVEKESANMEDISAKEKTTFKIEIYNNQAYLVNNDGERVFGPCRYIYDEIDCLSYLDAFRYIDNNGLIGYGKIAENEVSVLCPAIFSEAGKMHDGSACVKEGNELYYIDTDGKRFTNGRYKNAFPFEESQGSYARVQKMDGSWCIIDREENEFLTGFDYINELPNITVIGSGKKDGKAVLFALDSLEEDTNPTIIKKYEEYSEINEQTTDFAFVISNNGNKGAICLWNGEIIVPAEYEDIEWGHCILKNIENEQICFRCQRKNGTYDVVYWNAGSYNH